jgi:hypothetical protein
MAGAAAVQSQSQPSSSLPPSSPPTSVKTLPASVLSGQTLSEEQIEFVAGLYRQKLPAAEVARIVERMINEEGAPSGIGHAEGSSSGTGAVTRPADPAADSPPGYDFKS